MKYTVEWHDKQLCWDVVRWTPGINGGRIGSTVAHCDTKEQAQELCDYHNDMHDPEIYLRNLA